MKKTLLYIFFLLPFFSSISQTYDVNLLEINVVNDSSPKSLAKGTNSIFFSADDGVHGRELWTYGSIEEEAYMVKDINPGSYSGIDDSEMIVINEEVYFVATDENYIMGLWKSDGTENGTILLKAFTPANSFYTPQGFFEYNGNLIFRVDDGANGNELWISDGTPAGTELLKDIYPGPSNSQAGGFLIFNNLLFFSANDGSNGRELWVSDGTTGGTNLFIDINPTSDGIIGINDYIVFNNHFYFYANNSLHGGELWKSDGTVAGTQMLKDINPGGFQSGTDLRGAATDDYFVFRAYVPGISGELWISDGTEAGTQLLKDINPSSEGVQYDFKVVALNNKIYFTANDGINGEELWGTEGTEATTNMVKDIHPGSGWSQITELTATNNYLIFSAKSSSSGNIRNPWVSDGTEAGTIMLNDVDIVISSDKELTFLDFQNEVYFQGGEYHINGFELWKTDGTIANTALFKDINKTASGVQELRNSYATINNKLVFTGSNGMSGLELFITDGTPEGTNLLKEFHTTGSSFMANSDLSPMFKKAGNTVFFRAQNNTSGSEIFKTDGTEENTHIVKDIAPGSTSAINEYTFFFEYDGIFYFKANDQVHGEELWRTDGTESGTYMLKDINPGPEGSIFFTNVHEGYVNYPDRKRYAVLDGVAYFTANDGQNSALWKTDGTEAGTVKIEQADPNGPFYNEPEILGATSERLFFITNSTNSTHGKNTLWSTDGTEGGTEFLGLWNLTSSKFRKNTVHNDVFYFSTTGSTIMKSDGTPDGTLMVADNISTYDTFKYMVSCGDYVYFTLGQVGLIGKEFWRTDGTPEGTELIEESVSGNSLNFTNLMCIEEEEGAKLLYTYLFDVHQIRYMNDVMTTPDFFDFNVVNSNNFLVNEGVRELLNFNNNVLFRGVTYLSGSELYYLDLGNSGLGINDQEVTNTQNLKNIILYPNPAGNTVNVMTKDNAIILAVELIDLSGKKISAFEYYDKNINLNLMGLTSGVYLIKVVTERYTETVKLLIR